MNRIVIITSTVVAATAAAVRDKFDRYSQIGGIIGSSVSAGFLIILGIMNVFILYRLVTQLNMYLKSNNPRLQTLEGFELNGAGCLFTIMKKMFRIIDRQVVFIVTSVVPQLTTRRPWKMYPLGVLFGLGFDTSSEVALLGISSIQAAKGTSMWLILIFPILFTGNFSESLWVI